MQTITIVPPEEKGEAPSEFRAVANGRQASGRTMGEALDSLAATLPPDGPALVLIRKHGPDAFFTAEQHRRLRELTERGASRTLAEQEELETLLDAEFAATIARTDALVERLAP